MARSPIDMMVDEACGFDQNAPRPLRDTVTLRCPMCQTSKIVDRHKSDPPNTAVVESSCLKCHKSGDFENVNYLNSAGSQIDLDGRALGSVLI